MQNFMPEFIANYHYLAIFVLMLIESFIPIFPTEIVIPLAGVFAAPGKLNFTGVIAASVLGSMTGSSLWYLLARALGYKRFRHLVVRFGWITTLKEREVERLHDWFEKHETLMVFFGRFVPAIRNVISIPAGLVAMPYGRFLLLSAIAASLSNLIYAWAGWMLRDHYGAVEEYVGPVTTMIIVGLVTLWVVRMLLGLRRTRAEGRSDSSDAKMQ
jgi:membrane protein DedA with SNARE-associated domain